MDKRTEVALQILEKLNDASAASEYHGFILPQALGNIIGEAMFGHALFRETTYSYTVDGSHLTYSGRIRNYKRRLAGNTWECICTDEEKALAGKVIQRMIDKGVLLRTKNNTYKPLMTVAEYKATL